jgi:hypothetical protein
VDHVERGEARGEALALAGGHVALNYWFHPPEMGARFEAPYGARQEIWEADWIAAAEAARRGAVDPAGASDEEA